MPTNPLTALADFTVALNKFNDSIPPSLNGMPLSLTFDAKYIWRGRQDGAPDDGGEYIFRMEHPSLALPRVMFAKFAAQQGIYAFLDELILPYSTPFALVTRQPAIAVSPPSAGDTANSWENRVQKAEKEMMDNPKIAEFFKLYNVIFWQPPNSGFLPDGSFRIHDFAANVGLRSLLGFHYELVNNDGGLLYSYHADFKGCGSRAEANMQKQALSSKEY